MDLEIQLVGELDLGVYVEQLGLEISRRISNGSSVLTAELMAILWALWWIEEVKPREVIICSDSVGALDNLKVGKSKSRLFSTRFICNISFCWVPGHAGVSGNERVDNIAKESLGREVDVHVLLGRVELREKIKESLIKEWQKLGVDITFLYNLKLGKDAHVTFCPAGTQLKCAD